MTNKFKLPVGVFLLLIDNNGKLVMQLRENCSFSGMYGLVGGHLDGNESIAFAIIREAYEEIGVEINLDDLSLATVCHSNAGGNEYIQFYFKCNKWSGNIQNNEPEKCSEISSFALDDLPENTVPYIKEAIDKIQKNITFYESGF